MAGVDPATIGQLVRQERERVGLTQAQLAEASGLSDETVRRVELGKKFEPSLSTLVAIADALGLQVDRLLGRSSGDEDVVALPPVVAKLAHRAMQLSASAQQSLLRVATEMPTKGTTLGSTVESPSDATVAKKAGRGKASPAPSSQHRALRSRDKDGQR